MSPPNDLIVHRVVRALEKNRDPGMLVHAYFEEDRAAVLEATRETLEATRDTVNLEKIEAALDRELIEGLRFPAHPLGNALTRLYVRRGPVTLGAALVALLTVLLLLL